MPLDCSTGCVITLISLIPGLPILPYVLVIFIFTYLATTGVDNGKFWNVVFCQRRVPDVMGVEYEELSNDT